MKNNKTIPHSKPNMTEAEANAAARTIMSNNLAPGGNANAFENMFSQIVNNRHTQGLLTANGFAALRLALVALRVQPGDEVIVPAYSCMALINSVLSLGARPIPADIELNTLSISFSSVTRCLTNNTRAIIATHMFGFGCDFIRLAQLGVPLIEDMTHGFHRRHGAVIASFGPTKYLGSPRAGIICGPKPFIDMARFDQHNADKDACSWRHNDIADDVTAAILIEQLNRLEETKRVRKEKADYYDKLIADKDLPITKPSAHNEYNYRYCLFLQNKHAKYVVDRCKAKGVMIEQPVFDYTDSFDKSQRDFLVNTMLSFRTVISLPIYPAITEFEQKRVVNVLGEVLGGQKN